MACVANSRACSSSSNLAPTSSRYCWAVATARSLVAFLQVLSPCATSAAASASRSNSSLASCSSSRTLPQVAWLPFRASSSAEWVFSQVASSSMASVSSLSARSWLSSKTFSQKGTAVSAGALAPSWCLVVLW
eukprot:7910714-Heterocapsa_arctica.AAC.1